LLLLILNAKRDITVTKQRTKKDFAYYMKHLVDNVFTDAHKLVIVLDNLNTHFKKSIIDTFQEMKHQGY
jgi:Zn-dependent M16 (insulinase) family peptidase